MCSLYQNMFSEAHQFGPLRIFYLFIVSFLFPIGFWIPFFPKVRQDVRTASLGVNHGRSLALSRSGARLSIQVITCSIWSYRSSSNLPFNYLHCFSVQLRALQCFQSYRVSMIIDVYEVELLVKVRRRTFDGFIVSEDFPFQQPRAAYNAIATGNHAKWISISACSVFSTVLQARTVTIDRANHLATVELRACRHEGSRYLKASSRVVDSILHPEIPNIVTSTSHLVQDSRWRTSYYLMVHASIPIHCQVRCVKSDS